MRKAAKRVLSAIIALAMILSFSVSAFAVSDDGRYYADYNSYESALQAAGEVTEQIAAEGEILLKNNGILPMLAGGRVTVFGISSVNVIGAGNGGNFSSGTGGMSIADGLSAAGFVVNERINEAYKSINSTNRGDETPGLSLFTGNPYYEQTYWNHSDAAFIIISRDCAEGSDKVTNTGEKSAADAAAFDEAVSYAAGDVAVYNGVAYKFISDHTGAWNDADAKAVYSQMKHQNPATVAGVAYKHELQFTDSEEELIQYVEAQGFRHIILLMNSSNPFELYDAQNDPNIDAILWIGRPGADGLVSFGKIISGAINPSGRTVDLFFSDFTKDPTWQNFGNNSQTGSSNTYEDEATKTAKPFAEDASYVAGDIVAVSTPSAGPFGGVTTSYYKYTVDHAPGAFDAAETVPASTYSAGGVEYEEDIYMGYRYAETAANEQGFDFDYDRDVLYPFGYGLSYSAFRFDSIELYAIEDGKEVAIGSVAALADKFASSEENGAKSIAAIKQLIAKVNVTNTGSFAGKQTVQVYVNAPYTNAASSTQKAYVSLAGFGKTETLQPGASETVSVTINVQDIASYDAENLLGAGVGYTLERGTYNVMALSDSHAWANGHGFGVSTSFNLSKNVLIGLDDYTDNATQNLFSAENGMFYTIRDNQNASASLTGDWGVDTPAFNANDNDPMTRLVRGSFAETFPKSPTEDALTVSADFVNMYNYWYDYVLDGVTDAASGAVTVDPAAYANAEVVDETGLYVEKTNMPWLKKVNDLLAAGELDGYTQSTDSTNQIYSLSEVAGIDPYSDEVLTSGTFAGMTGKEAWNVYLNTLTWGQLVDVVTMQAASEATVPGGSYLDNGIKGNGSMSGVDSPLNLSSTYQFPDAPSVAATFNTDLARKVGEAVGNIALARGYNRWWGPTVNLHRSPFGGRCHEYFSSDPLLCGAMAALECSGAQNRGLACAPKHAVLNEQETGRSGLMTFASEQAIRELYARPLQMLVQEGEGMGAMGAMNRIGSLHNYGNYNFITGLLHDEWEMMGSYTTDMGGAHGTMNPELMVRAGLNDVNNGKSYFSVGAWDPSLRDGKGGVKVAVGTDYERESLVQYYSVRNSALGVLYMHANSAMNGNGYDAALYTGGALADGTQGSAYTASVTVPEQINARKALYSAEGLPSGLTLNADTGVISGTPNSYGTFDVTVTALLDSWISISAPYTMKIDPAFAIDAVVAGTPVAAEDNTLNANVGDEILIDILSDTISASPLEVNPTYLAMAGIEIVTGSTLEFSVKGELPAGLTMDENGSISGNVASAGEQSFTVVAKHTVYNNCFRDPTGIISAISMGPVNGVLTVNDYEVPVTLMVTGADGTVSGTNQPASAVANPADSAAVTALEAQVAGLTERLNAVETGGAAPAQSASNNNAGVAITIGVIVAVLAAAAVVGIVLVQRKKGEQK